MSSNQVAVFNEDGTSSDITDALAAAGIEDSLDVLDGDRAISAMIMLSRIEDELEARLKIVKRACDSIQDRIMEYCVGNQQQKVTRFGHTLYLSHEVWPAIDASDLTEGVEDTDAIAAAEVEAKSRLLEALSADPKTRHLVKPSLNWQTLRGFINNDCDKDENDKPVIPEHLVGKLRVVEKVRAKVRKS